MAIAEIHPQGGVVEFMDVAGSPAVLPEIVSVEAPPSAAILGGIGLVGALTSLPYVRAFFAHHARQLRDRLPRKQEEPAQNPKGEQA